jgi:prepilin-type N-terminal cleavage/methylation domain-containing protein
LIRRDHGVARILHKTGMKRTHGYTLLELAIVLMVLALLVGGILMLQDGEDAQPLQSTHLPK